MGLQFVEQPIRRETTLFEVADHAADADRNRFGIGVDETHADLALGQGADDLEGDAFLFTDIEAALQHFRTQEMHFLGDQGGVVAVQFLAVTGLDRQRRIDAVGQDHRIGEDLAALAVGFYPDHPARFRPSARP